VVKQIGTSDCGPAAVASLMRANGRARLLPNGALVWGLAKELQFKHGTDLRGQGTRARDIVKMLNDHGMQAVGAGTLVSEMAGFAAKGNKFVAQIDFDRNGQTNDSHWVAIDGINAQGQFLVKDPGTGTSYTLSAQQLQQAMDAGKAKNRGGGYIAVDPTSRVGLAPAAVEKALGDDKSGGIRIKGAGTEVAF